MVWIFLRTNESSLYIHALEYIHLKHTHFHILNACCNVVISNVTHISRLRSVFQPQQESSEKNLVSEKRIGFYNSQQNIYCMKMFSLILQLRQYSQTCTNGHLSTKSTFLFQCTIHLHPFCYFHIKYSFSFSLNSFYFLLCLTSGMSVHLHSVVSSQKKNVQCSSNVSPVHDHGILSIKISGV